jgi:hypothetical protein
MAQFESNLDRIKRAIKKWLTIWRAQNLRDVREVADRLSQLFNLIDEGPLDTIQLNELKEL